MKNALHKELSSSELSFFCTQMAMILKSGMLISDGIDWMYSDLEDGRMKNILGTLKEALEDKVPLYTAMEDSGCFPSHIVSMCQIGVVTGRLEDVMNSLSQYYDREAMLRSKIRNSIFYPAMLFVMMTFVIILLVTKIFPIFEGMVQELGGELPSGQTFNISFATGMMTGKFALIFVLAVLFIGAAMLIFYKSQSGKACMGNFLHRFVFTKTIMQKITAYRFSSGLSLLLSSGMNIESSMSLLLDVIEEPQLKSKLEQCSQYINSGDDFIKSVSRLSLFSGIHLQMLSMGQRIGETDVVMKKLTDIYENEADQAINSAVSLVEPVLVGVLCIVIGFILISVMLPLMNIMSSIG
ncbi:MAG TPA: hypothetical protein DC038_02515 [Clostridiales bacterium]|nr:hypothetical protein [Clostridiales bacterium]